jgi:hypothetical protein
MGRTRSLFDPDQSLYFLLAFRGRTTYRHWNKNWALPRTSRLPRAEGGTAS